MLKQGGNAVDVAIVEPRANGIGSDSFAFVWMKGKSWIKWAILFTKLGELC